MDNSIRHLPASPTRFLDMNPDDDPAPVAPRPPEPEDCCKGGCERCVFEIYEDALAKYENAQRAWEARRKDAERSE